MFNKIKNFIKEYGVLIVLAAIAALLLLLAVQTTGTVSLNSLEEVEGYGIMIDKIVTWMLLGGLVIVVSYIAVTGANKELDAAAAKMLLNLQNSDRFTQMEIDYESAPDEVKQMVSIAKQLMTAANMLLQSKSVDGLIDVVKDIEDGPEEGDV